mmetsp:Transcript_18302/g.41834  ORF Transcript_18302/g.41834 Transcript_18302/m.41834 type:complete len:309 (-) Transcript_18302:368-1294(-)
MGPLISKPSEAATHEPRRPRAWTSLSGRFVRRAVRRSAEVFSSVLRVAGSIRVIIRAFCFKSLRSSSLPPRQGRRSVRALRRPGTRTGAGGTRRSKSTNTAGAAPGGRNFSSRRSADCSPPLASAPLPPLPPLAAAGASWGGDSGGAERKAAEAAEAALGRRAPKRDRFPAAASACGLAACVGAGGAVCFSFRKSLKTFRDQCPAVLALTPCMAAALSASRSPAESVSAKLIASATEDASWGLIKSAPSGPTTSQAPANSESRRTPGPSLCTPAAKPRASVGPAATSPPSPSPPDDACACACACACAW